MKRKSTDYLHAFAVPLRPRYNHPQVFCTSGAGKVFYLHTLTFSHSLSVQASRANIGGCIHGCHRQYHGSVARRLAQPGRESHRQPDMLWCRSLHGHRCV
jgi:hypothetical protein